MWWWSLDESGSAAVWTRAAVRRTEAEKVWWWSDQYSGLDESSSAADCSGLDESGSAAD